MIFEHIQDAGLAQNAFLVGCTVERVAVVVDPLIDIDQYIDVARSHGMRIVAVAETHIHADFVSGARALAEACGATLYVSGEEPDPEWAYQNLDALDVEVRQLSDRETFDVGRQVRVEAIHTPGHTPEHLAFAIYDLERSRERAAELLSGDFLFVGDLGRPDLLEAAGGDEQASRDLAADMFESVRGPLHELPGDAVVWPGHGAGSACGKSPAQVPASTVGYERTVGWYADMIEQEDREAFVEELLSGQPPAPRYFPRMKVLNRDGDGLGDEALRRPPAPPRLTPAGLAHQLDEGAVLLDLRDPTSFAREHAAGSINLPRASEISTHAGWVVEPETPLVLLCPDTPTDEAVRALQRVGLGPVVGTIPALSPWVDDSDIASYDIVSPVEAHALWEEPYSRVIDVRSADEYAEGHIPGATHVMYGLLPDRMDEIPRDKALIVHCATGVRASVAASLLERNGFGVIKLFPAGPSGWEASNYPLDKADET